MPLCGVGLLGISVLLACLLSCGHHISSCSAAAPSGSPQRVTIGAGNASWTGVPRILAWYPLVIAYDDFLSDAECEHVLQLARPRMEPAMLVNREVHQHRKSPSRTSHGAFFDDADDPVLAALSQRVAHAVQLPAGNMEPYQVMQYGHSEHISIHVDYSSGQAGDIDDHFFGRDEETFGGQRVKTALLYLTNCERGGETVFWKAVNNSVGLNSCQGKGLGIKAQRGMLLVWANVLPTGDADVLSTHTSCPVRKGTKVVVSRFVRASTCPLNSAWARRKWNGNVYCEDEHASCATWAARGFCVAADAALRRTMVGDQYWPGFCEKACGTCRPLEDTVVALRRELQQPVPPGALPQ